MLLIALVLVPAVAAAIAAALTARSRQVVVLLLAAAAHATMVATLWSRPAQVALAGWLADDSLGLLILTLESALFVVVATYSVGLLRVEKPRGGRAFVSGLLAFLSAVSLVALSQHVALLWVGMEATTLSVAPLIYHRRDRRSLEAVWKYLVLSSVGIAFALLAVFLLATAQPSLPDTVPLLLSDLVHGAAALDRWWLRAAFVFALIGFGTKMGLAPLHTWKPDTYGEAPSLIGGLMSGGLTSCAFLGLARFTQVMVAANDVVFIRPLFIAFGLLSLVVATAFIIGQSDLKRLLAYSSVEHMGLLVLGLGIGGLGAYGTVLHVLNNGLLKGALFLVVGNLVLASGSSVAADLRGLLRRRPRSATLLVAGLFAVTGTPPFGLFLSEYAMFRGAVQNGQLWIALVVIALLSIIFVGLSAMILDIVLADKGPPGNDADRAAESGWLVVGPAVLVGVVLLLGIYIPAPLQTLLASAAATLGGPTP